MNAALVTNLVNALSVTTAASAVKTPDSNQGFSNLLARLVETIDEKAKDHQAEEEDFLLRTLSRITEIGVTVDEDLSDLIPELWIEDFLSSWSVSSEDHLQHIRSEWPEGKQLSFIATSYYVGNEEVKDAIKGLVPSKLITDLDQGQKQLSLSSVPFIKNNLKDDVNSIEIQEKRSLLKDELEVVNAFLGSEENKETRTLTSTYGVTPFYSGPNLMLVQQDGKLNVGNGQKMVNSPSLPEPESKGMIEGNQLSNEKGRTLYSPNRSFEDANKMSMLVKETESRPFLRREGDHVTKVNNWFTEGEGTETVSQSLLHVSNTKRDMGEVVREPDSRLLTNEIKRSPSENLNFRTMQQSSMSPFNSLADKALLIMKDIANLTSEVLSRGHISNEAILDQRFLDSLPETMLEKVTPFLSEAQGKLGLELSKWPMEEQLVFLALLFNQSNNDGQEFIRQNLSKIASTVRNDIVQTANIDKVTVRKLGQVLNSFSNVDQVDLNEIVALFREKSSDEKSQTVVGFSNTLETDEENAPKQSSLLDEVRLNQSIEDKGSRNGVYQLYIGDRLPKQMQQQQFIKQLVNIVKRGTFTQTPQGIHTLSIKLHPEHLGRLSIQISQQEGLITAKIIAANSASREIIDANIHHLRQTFTQQQMQIDRIVVLEDQQLDEQNSKDKGSSKDQQPKEEQQGKRDRNNQVLFEDFLQDATINEQV
ncbi:hypothetical protein JCM9140_169 [Halalkalibacter wakoensis JCM 9140]|uniref:Flagellar hook-length control protein-like C-terminal domain-containing protein n=1 Tax=Halalkalibacter wakoensis JCM 9140 TaxID=1236970 RepID=W4PWM1_9BACI|nr:flagellar hook-length control protein FliK [Halalkalibacter wakoensis]GAE24256.1 hypothetical protein JCM9140_169 [Halalkalibacter wakoensis JCM 9140]